MVPLLRSPGTPPAAPASPAFIGDAKVSVALPPPSGLAVRFLYFSRTRHPTFCPLLPGATPFLWVTRFSPITHTHPPSPFPHTASQLVCCNSWTYHDPPSPRYPSCPLLYPLMLTAIVRFTLTLSYPSHYRNMPKFPGVPPAPPRSSLAPPR